MQNHCLTSGRASAILKSSLTPLHTPTRQHCSSLPHSSSGTSTSSHNHPSISLASHHRPRFCRSVVAHASFGSLPSVDIEEGKKLLDKGLVKFIDIRPRNEWDEEHIVKPPRSAFSVPFDECSFVEDIASQFPNKAAGLLVVCTDGGAPSSRAVELLVDAGYTGVKQVMGGYSAWTKVFSTSGRRKPPPGRWVSTGKEALKSGLTIPGAAESYEEGGNLKKARYAQGFTSNESGLL